MKKNAVSLSLSGWIPLLIFILLVMLVVGAGVIVFKENKKLIIQDEFHNLGAIADLKVAQITAWSDTQRRRATFFLYGAKLPEEFERWAKGGGRSGQEKQQILDLLKWVKNVQGYKIVSVLDLQGTIRISTDASEQLDQEELSLAREAMRGEKVVFLDLHKDRADQKHPIELSFFAPLSVGDRKGGRIVGAVRLVIDPDSFLYPVIRSWPTPSKSAETVLVRREGDDILFLNELRHRRGTALSLRIPISAQKLPPAMWMRGQFNPMEGIDYRGVAVVSAVRPVPGMPWLLVAKIDRDELLAPVTVLQNWVAGLSFLFISVGGLLIAAWFKWRQAQSQRLQAQHDAALERQALVRHFDYLTRFGNDIVLLVDDQGRIVETNDRAAAAYGYTADELKAMPINALLPAGRNLGMDEIKRSGGMRFESIHVRKDKSEFPVETSVRPIEIEGKTFFQGIVRDITERRAAEEAALHQKMFLHQVIDTDPNQILVTDAEGKYLLVNKAMAEAHGMTPEEMVGHTRSEVNPFKDETELYEKLDLQVIETRQPVISAVPSSIPDGQLRWFLSIKVPMEQADGTVNVLGVSVDITDSKIAEEKLQASCRELEKITTHLEVVREEEQKRVARDLHDEMGSILTALNISVSMLAEKISAESPQRKKEMAYLEKLVAEGIRTMRQIVSRLRPTLLDEVGLAFAIEQYAREFRENMGIECNLRFPAEEPVLSEQKNVTLFRIVQEALTNVAKHAQASKVDIILSDWEGNYILTVKDNGRGFDPNFKKARSFGLVGIKERAAMAGGKAEVISQIGKGTTIRVSMPRS